MQRKKLKIVVIGYYGKLNAGDDLLQQSISSIFQEHDLLFTSWFPGTDFLNQADLVVVGGGSIWPGNPVFQNASKLAKVLTTPLIVLGISAKKEDSKVAEGTRALIDKALFFHVRDQETKKIIGDDRIIVGPDLYWWSYHEITRRDDHDQNVVCLNLRPWSGVTWEPSEMVSVVQSHFDRVQVFPLYFGSAVHESGEMFQDVELLRSLNIGGVPNSFTLDSLCNSTVSVAMRFHAILMSVRAGVPVIGFDYHKKTKNFFLENGIGELCVPLGDLQALSGAIKLVNNNYEKYSDITISIRENYLQRASEQRSQLLEIVSSVTQKKKSLLSKLIRKVKGMVL